MIKIFKQAAPDNGQGTNSAEIAEQLGDLSPALTTGPYVTPEQIEALSKNLFTRLYVVDGPCLPGQPHTQARSMSCTDPSIWDTKTAYFEKDALDALFSANPGSNGLLISFGIHDSKIYGPLRSSYYENKLMVVLITTTDEVPNLEHDDKVLIPGADEGLDNGKLCPPDRTC